MVDLDRMDVETGGAEPLGVLEPVLLGAHYDDIRRELHDALDVRILGSTDFRKARLVAEPRDGDGGDAQREEGLRRRRDEAHDSMAHGGWSSQKSPARLRHGERTGPQETKEH